MERCPVVFIGGLTNGEVTLDYLLGREDVSVPLVITYPDGVDKPRKVNLTGKAGVGEYIQDTRAGKYRELIGSLSPEFIIVAGWSYMLPGDLLSIPSKGTIGFHPSRLPQDRGRSVLAWQIEEGYGETALTMFYYNELPDAGEIIAREKIVIEESDYISDLLDKVDCATLALLREYFPLLLRGEAPRIPQGMDEGNYRKLRTDRNSTIDWERSAEEIYNKIRAVSRPYPGATAEIEGDRYRVWRGTVLEDQPYCRELSPGEVADRQPDGALVIKCGDGFLRVYDYERI